MHLVCKVVKDRLHLLAWFAPRRRKQHDTVPLCNESSELFGFQVYDTVHFHLTHDAISDTEIAAPSGAAISLTSITTIKTADLAIKRLILTL